MLLFQQIFPFLRKISRFLLDREVQSTKISRFLLDREVQSTTTTSTITTTVGKEKLCALTADTQF